MMMKKRMVLVFFLIVLPLFIFAEDDEVEVSEDVLEIVEDEGEVDVIIVMKEAEEGIFSDTEVEERKEEVLEVLDDIDAEVEIELETAVAATVDEDQLEELLQDDNILEIYEDRPITAFLSTATSHIKGDLIRSLQYNGSNITGAGQTVCIIDSGIDYTHPSLGGCFGAGCRVVSGYDVRNDDADPQDDNGHGTHVAGIAGSSNLTLPGIAPGIQFAALKVLNAGGSGSTSDLISGIEWCTNNATTFNISVISMSLGTNKKFSGTCDDDDSQLTAAINNAVAGGIFVVASSGNENSDSKMGSPACITNVTAVANADESNIMVSSSNRNEETDIIAPGSLITSMYKDGGFATLTGTSMSTPFISGAGALLKQFHTALNGTVLSTDAIVGMMNSTGDDVDDTANSGFVYKMINLENLFDTLDEESPVLSFVSPTVNGTNTSSYSYIINVSADETLAGSVLEFDGVNQSMNGGGSNFYLNKTFVSDGTHTYRVFANDSFNNSVVSEVFDLRIQNDAPSVSQVVINTSLGINSSTGDLQCFGSGSDTDGDSIIGTVRWFNDSVEFDRTDIQGSVLGVPTLIDTIGSGNTSVGDTWTCMVNVGDLKENSNFVNSSVVITNNNVNATIDRLVLNSSLGLNRTGEDVSLYATVSDADGDNVVVNVRWFKNTSEEVLFNQTFNIVEGAFTKYAVIDSDNSSKNDHWTAQISLDDGTDVVRSNHTLVVKDTPPEQVVNISDQSWAVDTNISLNLSDYFNDTDGDLISYSGSSLSDITLSITNDNASFIPDPNETVTTSVLITASTGDSSVVSNNVSLTVSNDIDGDGFIADTHGGLDCNDNADNINPNAAEACFDGVDNNCDGTVDEGCTSSSSGSSGGGGGGGGDGSSSTTPAPVAETPEVVNEPTPSVQAQEVVQESNTNEEIDEIVQETIEETVQQQSFLNQIGGAWNNVVNSPTAAVAVSLTKIENFRGVIMLLIITGGVVGLQIYKKRKLIEQEFDF